MKPVDLRSDTVTRPTTEMYAAMMEAQLDDDVLGHDPTTERLESLAASMVGMDAALFMPSGTMANQVAIATHVSPGDSILVDDDAHVFWYECGAIAVVAGVVPRTVPSAHGVMDPDAIASRYMPKSEHTPGTTLLCLENTHNRAGGAVTPLGHMKRYREEADRLGLNIHLDGARVFNAAVALGVPVSDICGHVDSVSFCLSKGLGAPVGSLLCGSSAFIGKARYWRKRYGGGLRQSGVLAACGLVSLNQMVDRLADDHVRAKRLADGAAGLGWLRVVPPQTNILMLDTLEDAAPIVSRLESQGVWCYAIGPKRIRMVTHKDVDDDGVGRALEALASI